MQKCNCANCKEVVGNSIQTFLTDIKLKIIFPRFVHHKLAVKVFPSRRLRLNWSEALSR